MKILYLSCHSILEHDEVKLFTELGHQVFSFGGYRNPEAPHDPKRPGFKGFYSDQLEAVAIQCSQDNLHQELIDWADVIIIMHRSDWAISNWEKIKHKKVILRTIGQNTSETESRLVVLRSQGLKIVRYSPEERNLGGYVGEDAMIRFYLDPDEFRGYTGGINAVMTVCQSMKQRGIFCGYDIMRNVFESFASVVFGPGNEEIDCWGGLLTYDELKKAYQNHRVYFYTGTYPASYVLNFMEAFMTGIPIVAIGRGLANIKLFPDTDVYEVDKIISNGINGYVSDDIEELKGYIQLLLNDPEKAKEIGQKGRETAIELFGKEKIKAEWKAFFDSL